MRRRASSLFVLAVLLAVAPRPVSADCPGLKQLALKGVTVTRAEIVAAGSFSPPTGRPLANLPGFCRVAGAIAPSPGSAIPFEVWMPTAGWTGRFQGVGNFGFGGEIAFDAMAAALRRGNATASTDTGHRTADWASAEWARGHSERVVDFGYRAIHETTVASKAVIRAFYGEGPAHSYFSSCSNGGRQALMEAQRYPHDYDGIIAGAPAHNFTHLLAHAAWIVNVQLRDELGHIPADKLPAIQAAALSACDGQDGMVDGVIADPERCHPIPSSLAVPGNGVHELPDGGAAEDLGEPLRWQPHRNRAPFAGVHAGWRG